jgi:hypothetical protein
MNKTLKRQLILARANDVTRTILQQLGGGGFLFMVGASEAVHEARGVSVRFTARAKHGINTVWVYLDDDTYTVEFARVRGTSYTRHDRHEGVYADQLPSLFHDATGLATAVPRIVGFNA